MRHVATRHIGQDIKAITEPVFLILASLLDQPRHGYSVIQEVRSMSAGRVELSTGTLYGALRRLLDDGLIERYAQEDTSRDKQAYILTAAGRRQVEAEANRMRQLVAMAQQRLKHKQV